MSFICYVLVIFVVFWASAFAFFKWRFTFWKRKNLPYLKPTIPFGDSREVLLQKCTFNEQVAKHYSEIKKLGHKHAGIFIASKPFYIPVDPELIKNVLQRDFEHFTDRGVYKNQRDDPLSVNLISLNGAQWRNLRVKLTPTFSSSKLKNMFKTLTECSKPLHSILQHAAKSQKPIDIKDLMARYTTDIISMCAFGLDSSSLATSDSELRVYGKRTFENSTFETLRDLFLLFIIPHGLLYKLHAKRTKPDVERFFFDMVSKNLNYRKDNNISRNDFFQLLLELYECDSSFTFNDFVSQIRLFYIAGFNTTHTLMVFACFELCLNEDIQEKLRTEIIKVLNQHNIENEVTYDALMDMKYLDQVLDETLRKHPPGATLLRQVSKAYKIPGTDVTLDRGQEVLISVLGLHWNADYYPKPQIFDPERFSPENKKNRPSGLYIPFGDGPRNCIGLRFGLMQAKLGLVTLLRNYKLTLNEKTKLPLKIDPHSIIVHTTPDEAIWLNVKEI